jgi:hypothetical protein
MQEFNSSAPPIVTSRYEITIKEKSSTTQVLLYNTLKNLNPQRNEKIELHY